MTFKTADLYDEYGEDLKVALPIFKDYGGKKIFHGAISTIKAFEDNSLVRKALEEPGDGRVLIVDGEESLRCAMVGDRLYTDMAMATRAGVKGILVLSGEATESDVAALTEGAEQIPALIVGSVDELLR